MDSIGLDEITRHEEALLAYGQQRLAQLPKVRLIGTAPHKAGILSFVCDDIHAHDIGTILDSQGVAIRAGHHCAMPLMHRFGVSATARASLAMYNDRQDIDQFISALERALELFAA